MPRTPRRFAITLSTLGLAALAAALTAFASPAAAQQKYRLKEAAAKGDASDNNGIFTLGMKITATVGGIAQNAELRVRQEEKYHEEVLAVDAKGIPTSIRRSYSVKKETGQDPGEEAEKTTVSPLQGRTVTIRRNGAKVEVTADKGTIPAKERKELEDALKDSSGVFPDREVGPGDDWDVDPKAAKFLGDADVTKANCHFQDVVDYEGHKCAHIHLTLDFSARTGDQSPPLKCRVAGDLYQALDIQRGLAMNLTGTASMKGDLTANGTTLSFNGEGPVEMKMSAKWMKVSGKAVAPGGA